MSDSTTITLKPPGLPAWPKDALRITFGVIWGIDAVLKWLPGFRSSYLDSVKGLAQGQPGWLRWWFDAWTRLQAPRANLFVDVVAVVETLVALALIFGIARKVTYIGAAAFAVLIWSVAEGFGGPFSSGAADVGAAIIYSVVFLFLLALNYYAGPSRHSVDYHLEKRISWWWRVAEMRRPVATAPATAPVSTLPYQQRSA